MSDPTAADIIARMQQLTEKGKELIALEEDLHNFSVALKADMLVAIRGATPDERKALLVASMEMVRVGIAWDQARMERAQKLTAPEAATGGFPRL